MREQIIGLSKSIRKIPDFPKKGIIFWDMTTLFSDPGMFHKIIDTFYKRYKNKKIDKIIGIESRGFVLASALAYKLRKGIILVRKKGKLPYITIEAEYTKEYGKDKIEIHKDAIKKNEKVLIIDDLLATGETCKAVIKLVNRLKGKVAECAFVVELLDFDTKRIFSKYKKFSLIEAEENEK